MNKRIVMTALALLSVGSALAEPPGPSHGRGGPDIDRMAILLDLNEGQKVAVKQVFDEQAAKRKEERSQMKEGQTRPSREEMRAKHEAMRKETTEKMRGILSDVQMTKFEALMAPPAGMPDRRKAQ